MYIGKDWQLAAALMLILRLSGSLKTAAAEGAPGGGRGNEIEQLAGVGLVAATQRRAGIFNRGLFGRDLQQDVTVCPVDGIAGEGQAHVGATTVQGGQYAARIVDLHGARKQLLVQAKMLQISLG